MNRASADLLGLRRPSGGVSAPLVEAIFPGFEFSNILAKHTSLRGLSIFWGWTVFGVSYAGNLVSLSDHYVTTLLSRGKGTN